MRLTHLAAVGAILASAPAFAQSDTAAPPPPVHHHHHHSTRAAESGGERPIDVGPNTPQANAAYQGGGVILQGAPGAPPPRPQATPPGQTPVGSVPP
jgi:hypothetical protein